MISLMMTVKMMRMIIFATLRGDRPEAGAGNPLIGQIGDQDITGLDQAVRHDHRHQGHDHRHQGHDHRHQGHDHRHRDPRRLAAASILGLGIQAGRLEAPEDDVVPGKAPLVTKAPIVR